MSEETPDEMPDYVLEAFMRGEKVERIYPILKFQVQVESKARKIALLLEIASGEGQAPHVCRGGLSQTQAKSLIRMLQQSLKGL